MYISMMCATAVLVGQGQVAGATAACQMRAKVAMAACFNVC